MNSQEYDILSREIESLKRQLAAGIPVPEKKKSSSSSDLLSFASLKDLSGASATGWATRYLDSDKGEVLTYFLTRTIGRVPTSRVDFSSHSSLDVELGDPTNASVFCYDISNTGSSLNLYFLTMSGYSYLSNAISMTKVASSRSGSSALNRVAKFTEITGHYEYTAGGSVWVQPIATISSTITNYTITDVFSGSGGSFSISGDHTTEFANGASFFVTGSTGNDKTYSVYSSSYSSGTGKTTIVVTGSIPSATVDGSLGTGGGCLAFTPLNVNHLCFTNPPDFGDAYSQGGGYVFHSRKNNNWYCTKSSFQISRNNDGTRYDCYHDDTGTISTITPAPCINPISVPDSFITKGRVCLEQISPRSNTVLVRLRHDATGDLYEGSFTLSVASSAGTDAAVKYGKGYYYGWDNLRFLLPTPGQSNPDVLSAMQANLTMTVLPQT